MGYITDFFLYLYTKIDFTYFDCYIYRISQVKLCTHHNKFNCFATIGYFSHFLFWWGGRERQAMTNNADMIASYRNPNTLGTNVSMEEFLEGELLGQGLQSFKILFFKCIHSHSCQESSRIFFSTFLPELDLITLVSVGRA